MPPQINGGAVGEQLIKNLRYNVFASLRVQVVKYYDEMSYVVLDVTDYTRNELLPEVKRNDYNKQAVEGKFTLKVECLKQNAEWARQNARVGSYLEMRNCRIKQSRGGYMQGTIWGSNKGWVDVDILQDRSAIRDLEGRRRGLAQPPSGPTKDRKRKLQDREPAETSTRARPASDTDAVNLTGAVKESASENGRSNPASDSEVADLGLPKQIKISRNVNEADSAVSSFTDLIRPKCICKSNFDEVIVHTSDQGHACLPYAVFLHSTILRVVDYYPHNMHDFASDVDGQWQWTFSLFVADGLKPYNAENSSELLQVFVTPQDAFQLLGIRPCSMKQNPATEELLKFKLFFLWGNLQEDKDKWFSQHGEDLRELDVPVYACKDLPEGVISTNKPFKCCIAEVGNDKVDLNLNRGQDRRLFFLRHTEIDVKA